MRVHSRRIAANPAEQHRALPFILTDHCLIHISAQRFHLHHRRQQRPGIGIAEQTRIPMRLPIAVYRYAAAHNQAQHHDRRQP